MVLNIVFVHIILIFNSCNNFNVLFINWELPRPDMDNLGLAKIISMDYLKIIFSTSTP